MSTVFGGVHTIHSLPALPGGPVLRSYSEPINREGEILCWDCEELSSSTVVPEQGEGGRVTTE